ncbi:MULTISPECIES: tripartite tricarboxylate transporter TctB family protein [Pacificibacter]|uniref:tripartite tricarboxylate transporter TctB family protein n=1 Tax=Pacificibacter TaxID=1042323 RepID=UPI001C0926DA|nr:MULTISPECIES: tripartite tricarboxylate transporter TctB family protein [Pacificibacter]MBU2936752.1 tripartite tricarboxylate transporter TctB family protein [Pacificibacter marinus]MDO6617363.1 tripartite tricarboxylate transporter TctB family protein [Pacificibacter sp. 1_MG-2023]
MSEEFEVSSDAQVAETYSLNFNVVCGIGFIIAGIVIWVITPHQVEKALVLFGDPSTGLDPHLFPRIVGMAFVCLGLWYLVKAGFMTEKNLFRELDREAFINTTVSLAAFTAFAVLMTVLGFVVSSALLIFGLSTFYGNRTYWLGLLVALAMPLAIFNLFTRVMQVFLPAFPFADMGWF